MTKPTAAEKAQGDEDLDLFEQLKTLGEGTTIQVYREPGRDFLDTIPADAVEVEHIKGMFGGGSYSLRARRDGTWVKGVSMVRLKIAGTPKPGSPGQPLAEVPGAPLVAAPGTVEARLAEIEARTGIVPAPPVAPDASAVMLQMMTGLLVPVLTTALQRQPENSAVEILELARKLAKDQRDAGETGRNSEGDLVRDMGIPLVDFITRGLPTPEAPKALAPAPSTDPPPVPTDAELGDPPPLPTTMELAGRIAAWCEPLERRDRDPRLRAEVFLEDLEGTPMMDGVLELIALPTCLDLWANIAPRVNDNRGWYEDFVDELRKLTAPEADVADDPDPVGDEGDAGDAASNGEVGAERVADAGDPGARA